MIFVGSLIASLLVGCLWYVGIVTWRLGRRGRALTHLALGAGGLACALGMAAISSIPLDQELGLIIFPLIGLWLGREIDLEESLTEDSASG